MKALTEYIQKKHIEKDMDYIISDPIREYMNYNNSKHVVVSSFAANYYQ